MLKDGRAKKAETGGLESCASAAGSSSRSALSTLAAAYLAPLTAVAVKDLVGREYVGSFLCLALVFLAAARVPTITQDTA